MLSVNTKRGYKKFDKLDLSIIFLECFNFILIRPVSCLGRTQTSCSGFVRMSVRVCVCVEILACMQNLLPTILEFFFSCFCLVSSQFLLCVVLLQIASNLFYRHIAFGVYDSNTHTLTYAVFILNVLLHTMKNLNISFFIY